MTQRLTNERLPLTAKCAQPNCQTTIAPRYTGSLMCDSHRTSRPVHYREKDEPDDE